MDPILFDWDGTLLDSLPALYRANVAVAAAFGLDFDETVYRRSYAPDWRRMYRGLGIPEARLDAANAIWLEAFDGGRDAELLPGAGGALERLRAAGRPLGLVTAGHRSIVVPQLERTGLADVFEVIVFGDDLAAQKPDPAPLHRALDALRLRPDAARATYLGDTPADMRMAVAAGARPVGIASLLGEAADLRAAGAVEVAPSVASWVDVVEARGFEPSAGSAIRRVGPALVPHPSDEP